MESVRATDILRYGEPTVQTLAPSGNAEEEDAMVPKAGSQATPHAAGADGSVLNGDGAMKLSAVRVTAWQARHWRRAFRGLQPASCFTAGSVHVVERCAPEMQCSQDG
ncbi:hypothetical protein CMUS01_07588 [Colletotrichum musicola]|uniref:Uncharacterized protein n=1 Tax=Colletotrichum musicola TaxID=2175873 RepID=A0A8H6NFL9_9PEZI|nr:hypothetical protein CMUS01_07588 [Colletotrichum musicola]